MEKDFLSVFFISSFNNDNSAYYSFALILVIIYNYYDSILRYMQYRQAKALSMTLNSEYRFTRNVINEGIILKREKRVRYYFLKSFY